MAKRPLAMCNQLTGCGKPSALGDEVIDSESVWACACTILEEVKNLVIG
jgi:hypothetical protein